MKTSDDEAVNNIYRELDSFLGCNTHQLRDEPSIEAKETFMSNDFFATIPRVTVHQLADERPRSLILHPRLDQIYRVNGCRSHSCKRRIKQENSTREKFVTDSITLK